jgi:hypothetical protein
VNEFIKFVLMAPGAMVWGWFQLVSAAWCVVGVLVLGLVGKAAGMRVGMAREVREEMAVRVEQGMPLMGMLVDGEGEKEWKEGKEEEGVKENGNGRQNAQ